jgi:hypothetical protein
LVLFFFSFSFFYSRIYQMTRIKVTLQSSSKIRMN